jgi:hypothetical protein
MKMRRNLLVHNQDITTSSGEIGEITLRVHHHQVNFQRESTDTANRLYYQRSKGDIGHKLTIHNIDLETIGTSRLCGLNLLR